MAERDGRGARRESDISRYSLRLSIRHTGVRQSGLIPKNSFRELIVGLEKETAVTDSQAGEHLLLVFVCRSGRRMRVSALDSQPKLTEVAVLHHQQFLPLLRNQEHAHPLFAAVSLATAVSHYAKNLLGVRNVGHDNAIPSIVLIKAAPPRH